MPRYTSYVLVGLICTLIAACKSSRFNLFTKQTPRERHADYLKKSGLDHRRWLAEAARSTGAPLAITLPYKEQGFYAPGRMQAIALQFDAPLGVLLSTTLRRKDTSGVLFLELYSKNATNASTQLLTAADTDGTLQYEIPTAGTYVLLIQPDAVKAVGYTLSITTGPSLAYPVVAPARNRIGSVWGDPRDAGARRHEGVDIFAAKGTPALAAADGRITNVTNGGLGGKTVWLRPEGRPYSLYYAHLDSQWVRVGEGVRTGDTIGQVGNTGNARTTAPHLHFGIYGFGGAVNPAPFIHPATDHTPAISAATSLIGKMVKAKKGIKLLLAPDAGAATLSSIVAGTPMQVEAAAGKYYRLRVADTLSGWLPAQGLKE